MGVLIRNKDSFDVENLTFSTLVNALRVHCGKGKKIDEYILDITDNLMESPISDDEDNPLASLTPDMRRRIFNGSRIVTPENAEVILNRLDKGKFVDFIDTLTADALEGMCLELSAIPLFATPINVGAVCADAFEKVLIDCSKGNTRPAKKQTTANTVVDSFVAENLNAESVGFSSQLRKNIGVICEGALNTLDSFFDLDNLIPSHVEEILSTEIINALKNKTPLDVDRIAMQLEIPTGVLEYVFDSIDYNLQTSLEYGKENYNEWLRQKHKDIETLLSSVQNDIREIKTAVIFDSAKKNSSPPSGKSRFHFTAKGDYRLSLEGRNAEILKLQDFCGLDESFNKCKDVPPFVWWMITGFGGTGKSKLCFEFANMIEEQGWTVCYPASHDKDTLMACSESLPNDTLFVLDYSEYNTGDIFHWMSHFGTDTSRRLKTIKIPLNVI